MVAEFDLALENDRWLNAVDFMWFCQQHQNQDIVIRVNNEAHCLEHCGVYAMLKKYSFRSVRLITCNALEQNEQYKIDNDHWYHWLEQIDDFDNEYDLTWDESKIFGCFFGRPSAPRLGIAGHLQHRHRLISDIHVQFDFDSMDNRSLFDIERLFAWCPQSLENVFLLRGLKTDHRYDKGRYAQSNKLSHAYKSIMIDIVSEPVCHGRSFYPTEKIARAMLCRRPFVVMASRNYLEYLRQMGFHTFHEFWDESYDGLDGADRYIKILALLDDLACCPKQRLVDTFYASQYQRDHNYDLLTQQQFKTGIVAIDG